WRAHLLLREQEVLHVTDDMLRLAADHDVIAAPAGPCFGEGRFWIAAFAVLVERRHLDIGAEPDAAAVRLVGTGQQIDQRGLAGAVRPDNAEPVASLDAGREVIDDSALPIGLADALRLDDKTAGFLGFRRGEIGVAGGSPVIAPLLAQRMKIAEPLDVALAASGDAVA